MEHKIKFIIFQVILISLIASIQITFSASPSFQFKQIMPRSEFLHDSPSQIHQAVLSDVDGNAIVLSELLYGQLIIQKIDRYGNTLWGSPKQINKVFIREDGSDACFAPYLVSDKQGGVFITYVYANFVIGDIGWWYNYDVHIQHIGNDAQRLWGDRGIALAATSDTGEWTYGAVSDDENGVIALLGGGKFRKIDFNGNIYWTGNEKQCESIGDLIKKEDKEGFYLLGSSSLQSFGKDAMLQWNYPFALMNFSLKQWWLLNNSIDNSIIVIGNTSDYRKIGTQKVSDETGNVLWEESGRLWLPPDSSKIWPIITKNGNYGAFIFYKELLQELDSAGNITFETPISVLDTTKFKYKPEPVSGEYVPGIGSFILYSIANFSDKQKTIVLQRVNSDKSLPWGSTGITIVDTTNFLNERNSIIKVAPAHQEAFIFLVLHSGIWVTKINLQTGGYVTNIKSIDNRYPIHFKIEVFPNPFNQIVNIKYSSRHYFHSNISCKVYNILGKEVKDLTNDKLENSFALKWDGTDALNQVVASGIYLLQLKTEHSVYVQKLIKID